jgi:hypothetical protein
MDDANTYTMVDANNYNMVDDSLPDDWEANPGQNIVGGSNMPRVSRSARSRAVGRSSRGRTVGGSRSL